MKLHWTSPSVTVPTVVESSEAVTWSVPPAANTSESIAAREWSNRSDDTADWHPTTSVSPSAGELGSANCLSAFGEDVPIARREEAAEV